MTGLGLSYVAAAGGGIASFLSPCVLPLVPAYICFVTGASLEDLAREENTKNTGLALRALASSVAFVLGFSTVFILLGATASAVSGLIRDHLDLLAQISGAVIIVLGLHYVGVFRIAVLYREMRFNPTKKLPGWFGAYVIGVAFAFGWTPCIGPILATILAIAASRDTLSFGVSLLAVYSLALGIPFIIAAIGIQSFSGFFQLFRRHLRKVEMAAGGLLIATGVMFLTGTFQILSYVFLDMFPALGDLG